MANDLDYQVEVFTNRLKKRARHLGKWARRNGIGCYRLYDRDIPEVPLVVDLYEDYLHIAEYYAPHKELPGPPEALCRADARRRATRARRTRGARLLQDASPDRARRAVRKARRGGVTAVVHEGGLAFRVNFSDYLDTGLFLDHRITRAMVVTSPQSSAKAGRSACSICSAIPVRLPSTRPPAARPPR